MPEYPATSQFIPAHTLTFKLEHSWSGKVSQSFKNPSLAVVAHGQPLLLQDPRVEGHGAAEPVQEGPGRLVVEVAVVAFVAIAAGPACLEGENDWKKMQSWALPVLF